MPPRDFIQAREQAAASASSSATNGKTITTTTTSPELVVLVDDRPYLPTTRIQLTDSDNAEAKVQVLGGMLSAMFGLSTPDPQVLHVERITGGCTNVLYRILNIHAAYDIRGLAASARATTVEPTENDNNKNDDFLLARRQSELVAGLPDSLLVRLFGAEGMINRDVETSTFAALAAARIGPPYWGAFANGRLEGWMMDTRPLNVAELRLPLVMRAVTRAMAQIHVAFRLPSSLETYHAKPTLWIQLWDWYEQAAGVTHFPTPGDDDRARQLQLAQIRLELEWLQSSVVPATAAVAFCHNDVLAANILFPTHADTTDDDQPPPPIQLIDFEYGGCNYCSFEIANHWNEWAGGPPDLTHPHYEALPTPDEQRLFVKFYLEHVQFFRLQQQEQQRAQDVTASTTTPANDEKKDNGEVSSTTIVVDDAAIDARLKEVQGFLLVNHLYWGLWAVNQAATEGCEGYDYMQYALSRFRQYWITKGEQHDTTAAA